MRSGLGDAGLWLFGGAGGLALLLALRWTVVRPIRRH